MNWIVEAKFVRQKKKQNMKTLDSRRFFRSQWTSECDPECEQQEPVKIIVKLKDHLRCCERRYPRGLKIPSRVENVTYILQSLVILKAWCRNLRHSLINYPEHRT